MKLKLAVNNTEYDIEAEDIEAALSKIPLTFSEVKTKGIITVSDGEKQIQHFFHQRTLRLIIRLPSMKRNWAKRLTECLAIGKSVI